VHAITTRPEWNQFRILVLKIFAFWDSMTKQRTDGALVRLITPVYESENLEEAEARLQYGQKHGGQTYTFDKKNFLSRS
jgi:hypothetical protein